MLLRGLLWHMHMKNGALYFPTPCRLDGLAMGALVAIWVRERQLNMEALRRRGRWMAAVAGAGLAVVVAWRGGFKFTDSANVVFGVALVGILTAGVILLIAEPVRGDWLAGLLTWRPLRTAGKYSYGLYLVHAVLQRPLDHLIPAATLGEKIGVADGWKLPVGVHFHRGVLSAALLSWHGFEKHWLKLKKYFDYKPVVVEAEEPALATKT